MQCCIDGFIGHTAHLLMVKMAIVKVRRSHLSITNNTVKERALWRFGGPLSRMIYPCDRPLFVRQMISASDKAIRVGSVRFE